MTKSELIAQTINVIAAIDRSLNAQVNKVLHHPRFQCLEASWRGLFYLVGQQAVINTSKLKIKLLGISWSEIIKDFNRSADFDQSQLFIKIYNSEFGQPGGEPFGLLLGDYQITHKTIKESPGNSIAALQAISQIAAAAFAPFITSASPSLFGLDKFSGLERMLDLARNFQQIEYAQWKNFCQSEDARFIGLLLPRVLMRLPYKKYDAIDTPFYFEETTDNVFLEDYLWGSPCYAFAGVIARAFNNSGWFADIRGVRQDKLAGGVVTDLARYGFETDPDNAFRYATDVCITDTQEKQLSDWGFISLCDCKYTQAAAFYGCQSVQNPKHYDRSAANRNAKLSSMLQYILCMSRFAHYIKVIARDKVGSFASATDCETYLQDWLRKYTAASVDLSPELKAKYPLREAKVALREQPGKPGNYLCIMHLNPHYELDQMESNLQLTTELVGI